MITADFDLNLSGFFSKLQTVHSSVAGMQLPVPSLGMAGLGDTATAIQNMQNAFQMAADAATPLQAAASRVEGALHGVAAVARVTSTAIAVLPGVFGQVPPAITRTLSAVSLASRGFDVLRGKMGPLGAATAYLEMRNLGLSKSYAGLAAVSGLATSAVLASTRRIAGAASVATKGVASGLGMASSALMGMGAFAPQLAALAGGAALVAAPFALIGKSVSEAGSFESMRTGFVTLLGSVESAQSRMEALAKFAETTPFELKGVGKASLVLETLTKGALSTGAGLTLVGDAAAASGQPFEELAMHIGRLYDGLQSGRPVGESLMRLQELGLVSGETRTKIEDLQKAGKKGAEVWGVAAAALGRFSGNMDRMSRTWEGLLSNLSDNISANFRNFGDPIMESLKPMLSSFVNFTEGLGSVATQAGQAVASSIQAMQGAVISGRIGDLLGAAVEVGLLTSAKNFLTFMEKTADVVRNLMSQVPGALKIGFTAITDPALWKSLGDILASVATGFASALAGALAPVTDGLLNILSNLGVGIDFRAGQLSEQLAGSSKSQWERGVAGLDQSAIGSFLKGTGEFLSKSFQGGSFAEQIGVSLDSAQSRLSSMVADLAAMAPRFAPEKPVATAIADPNAVSGSATKMITSSLASIGLGGYTSSSSARPELNEAKKTNQILSNVLQAIRENRPASKVDWRALPVPFA